MTIGYGAIEAILARVQDATDAKRCSVQAGAQYKKRDVLPPALHVRHERALPPSDGGTRIVLVRQEQRL